MLNKVTVWYIKILEFILVTFGCSLTVLSFVNAVTRKLGVASFYWSDEINRYLFVWITYLGVIVATYYGNMFQVDLLVNKFKPKARNIVVALGDLLAIIFLGVLFYGGIIIMESIGLQTSPIFGIPLSYIYIALPLCAASTIFLLLLNFGKNIADLMKSGKGA